VNEGRRRFQFRLRKLLLWTAVVALLLGVLKMLGLGPARIVLVACWTIVIVILGQALSVKAACRISGLAGVTFFAWITCCESPPHRFVAGMLLVAAPLGWILGYTGALLMNGAASGVSRMDNLCDRHD